VVDDGQSTDPAARLAAQIDVFEDRHVSGQRQILVDHLDSSLVGIARRIELHRLALDQNFAFTRPEEARKNLHQCRFTGTIVADDAQHLTARELQIDTFERRDGTKVFRYSPRFEQYLIPA